MNNYITLEQAVNFFGDRTERNIEFLDLNKSNDSMDEFETIDKLQDRLREARKEVSVIQKQIDDLFKSLFDRIKKFKSQTGGIIDEKV